LNVLARVRASTELQDLLFDLCDFEMPPSDVPLPQFRDGSSPMAFARDGAGGSFCLGSGPDGSPLAVIYVSTEGEAGVLGESVDAFFATIAALPYWRDCLHFSGGGDLDCMRRAAIDGERAAVDDSDDFRIRRERLQALLGLPIPADAIGLLHRAASSSPMPLVFEDGNGYGGLFNTFRPEDRRYLG
jgi:hypothetical protein